MLKALKQPGSLQCFIDNQHCLQYNISLQSFQSIGCIPCVDAVFPWQDRCEQDQDAAFGLPVPYHIERQAHTLAHTKFQPEHLCLHAQKPVTVDPHCQSAVVR